MKPSYDHGGMRWQMGEAGASRPRASRTAWEESRSATSTGGSREVVKPELAGLFAEGSVGIAVVRGAAGAVAGLHSEARY